MRLINADKLKPLFSPALTGKTTYTSDEIMLSIVSSATVEAIPIEFIKETIKLAESVQANEYAEHLRIFLEDWNEENEID